MADHEIAPDVIETAARALADWLNVDYDRIGDGQETLQQQAEAVLIAAAPHLEAAYAERKGKELGALGEALYRQGATLKGRWYGSVGGELRADASNLRNGLVVRRG